MTPSGDTADDMPDDAPLGVLRARMADLRVMVDEGVDEYEGISKADALAEALDAWDAVDTFIEDWRTELGLDEDGEPDDGDDEE